MKVIINIFLHFQIFPKSSFYLADFENQGAHTLAKQYDPEGKRTIGMSFPCHFIKVLLHYTYHRRAHKTRSYSLRRGDKLASFHSKRKRNFRKQLVLRQAAQFERHQARNYMGAGQTKRGRIFCHDPTMV